MNVLTAALATETRKAASTRVAAHQREFLALITEVTNDLCILRN